MESIIMRVRIIKRQNSSYIELPGELAERDEVELFLLKPGYYLLSLPLEHAGIAAPAAAGTERKTEPKAGKAELSERERAVLMKLLSIRFEQRIPAYVNKALDDPEKAVLKELERRGYVNVFKGTKYKEGVYNIRDSIYPLLSQKGGQASPAPGSGSAATAQPQTASNDLLAILKRQGFIVINDRNQARALSEGLSQEMKSGAVTGVKGFDNKFYVVTRSYLTGAEKAISAALKEDMDAASVAATAKLDPDGCLAALRVMCEAGEIIEKKKGVFAPV
jgi:hypothetical protein